ncbi:polysaccharide deacetylase family protein [Chloroflexi bacterium TSY]|nr:polysaccharide deacetylase family protein [Chloroflexi bacterium TSY]
MLMTFTSCGERNLSGAEAEVYRGAEVGNVQTISSSAETRQVLSERATRLSMHSTIDNDAIRNTQTPILQTPIRRAITSTTTPTATAIQISPPTDSIIKEPPETLQSTATITDLLSTTVALSPLFSALHSSQINHLVKRAIITTTSRPTTTIAQSPFQIFTAPKISEADLKQAPSRPEITPDGIQRSAQVPILMYHYLSIPPDDADIYRLDLSVTPQLFRQHLEAMQNAGYTTVRLDDLTAHLTQGTPLPEKPVIITFDDGYRDNYVNAFPLLVEYGMTATFFIVTDFIDEARPAYLTWDMVREMHVAGLSIESHSRNHTSLKNRDVDFLIWQALGSMETIEFELGIRPRFVSYPAGQFDATTIEVFKSANYLAGVTTIQGATHKSDNLFELHRVRVRGTTQPAELLRLLALDW